ncbi:MAG: Gfo/Idh/MocA family oxidoreductase [Candidatus Latescibacteria bacterium]|nr:Gfo/Idh/MocA family oxidoreductase [Candidatus Latescibacterota bacterium]
MRKLRVGVIGLGIGRGHAKAFQTHPLAEVVALADQDEARLKKVGEELDIRTRYTSGEEMLKKESLDIVAVATPNKFHKPLTVAALRAGAHVFCEKPMAMQAQEAREMIEASKKAKRRIMIDFSYRFNPESLALKQEVDRGTIGEVYFARTSWLRRRGMPGFGGWFGQKSLAGGGPLIDLGVHRIDLALWLMGYPQPKWVMGSTYDFLGQIRAKEEGKPFDVEDLAVGLVKFENGATLEIEAGWAAHIKERELMETRLLGTKGGLIQRNINEGYEFEAELFFERDGCQYDLKPHAPIAGGSSAMHHFVDCLVEDKPHTATGEEGLIVMQLLDAIYESAEKGAPVQIASSSRLDP